MASDVMTLFNMPSAEDTRRAYLDSQMISPTQLGSQGLFQQAVSLGANRGTILGEGVGRLFGGMAPQEARARGIEEAMMKVQGMGLTSDADMYSALSKELASRGLTQDAFMANKEARTAMRDEQLIKKGGFDIQKAQIDIQKGEFDLQKAKEDMLTLEEQIAIAMSQGEESKVVGLQRQLAAKKQAAAAIQAEIEYKTKAGNAAMMNAEANKSRVGAAAEGEKFTIPVYAPGIVPGTRGDIIGRQNKLGQVMGNDGAIYNSVNELMAGRAQAQPAPAAPPVPNTDKKEKKKPTVDISQFFGTGLGL